MQTVFPFLIRRLMYILKTPDVFCSVTDYSGGNAMYLATAQYVMEEKAAVFDITAM